MSDLVNWQPRQMPSVDVLEGAFTRLEKLDVAKHAKALFEASSQDDTATRHLWLFETAPDNFEAYKAWAQDVANDDGVVCYAVIDKRTNIICGRQMFMRMHQVNGSIEIGSIFWNKDISQTPVTTEALYLFAAHAFEDLGYRRFEWKCNNNNEPSKKAALRFGFQYEGLFRQHMIIKGKSRDTAWFSMIDKDWPALKQSFDLWLSAKNFDENGQQKKKLTDFR